MSKRDKRKKVKQKTPQKVHDVWGVFDTKDNCWLGDKTGPKLFTLKSLREDIKKAGGDPEALNEVGVENMANISAQMAAMQVGTSPTRFRARPFNEKNLRYKDDIKTRMDPLKALERVERGCMA